MVCDWYLLYFLRSGVCLDGQIVAKRQLVEEDVTFYCKDGFFTFYTIIVMLIARLRFSRMVVELSS